MRNQYLLRYVSLFIVFVSISLSSQQLFLENSCHAVGSPLENDYINDSSNPEICYGLVIPLISGENLPYTSIQQAISNFVNDLLRLDVPVFWGLSNFSSLTRTMVNDSIQTRFFDRGAFLVPFTENHTINHLIISVATDYLIDSEIETFIPVSMFYILEPISLDVIPLKYAKCAIWFGVNIGFGDAYAFSDILHSSGFFDVQLLTDGEICSRLKNDDFNVFIWPGGLDAKAISFLKDASIPNSRTIRSFVNNGGGFIGTCYGAEAAASFVYLPIYLPWTYCRYLPSWGFLALTSCSALTLNCGAYVTITLVNRSHPVSFGLDPTQHSFHIGGPVFPWATMNQNTQALGILNDVQVEWWRKELDQKRPSYVLENIINIMKGKPIWISSNFGDGKVVAFGNHPEFHFPNRQDRVIDNSILYVTSGNNTRIHLTVSMFFSEIIAISMKTSDIELPTYHQVFYDIWDSTQVLNSTCKTIDDALLNVILQISRINEERETGSEFITYSHDLCQHWLRVFSETVRKYEQVYTLTKNTTYSASAVSLWRNKTNTDLHILEEYYKKIVDNCSVLQPNIEKYIGSHTEQSYLRLLIDNVERFYRKGYNLLNKLWSSTVEIYRDCWYMYESQHSPNTSASFLLPETLLIRRTTFSHQKDTLHKTRMIFVDDDASRGGDGTTEHPYQHIQDAIDTSNNGDSIFVHTGWYYENLYIGKSINLIGEEKNTTIIDGQNRGPFHHITITKPYVCIKNFTIQNSKDRNGGIVLYSSNNTICGNILKKNGIGVGLNPKSSNNTIVANLFINNRLYGTAIDTGTQRNNCIEDNIFRNNTIGLYLVNVTGIIKNNKFYNDGIFFSFSSDPESIEIINNTVNEKPLVFYRNTSNFTITDAGQIFLLHCRNGLIDHLMINDTETGIYLLHSSAITVSDCTITFAAVGIVLQSSEKITLIHNYIQQSRWLAVRLKDSEKNHLFLNTFSENNYGLFLNKSSDNIIEHNHIAGNTLGFSCWYSSNTNEILKNNFLNNHENAFDICNNQWEKNYWDDWRGLEKDIFKFLPYHIPGRALLNFDSHPAYTPYEIS